MHEVLALACDRGASDIHITVGSPIIFRINGHLYKMNDRVISETNAEDLARCLMPNDMWEQFRSAGDLDFSYTSTHDSTYGRRFRINVYRQKNTVALCVRIINPKVPTAQELGLPEVLLKLMHKSQGLFIVTGPTGSGKSTTLAALIDYINETQTKHIVTLEDPIEYVHKNKLSVINQREVGTDTENFAKGLRAALRQDPDVIMVGEMRDLETISTAITAAETGHLVLGTLHTINSVQTIDRIIDVFPPGQQQQIRTQFASVLVGIVAQRLLPTVDGMSRVAALEVLINNAAVANLMRNGKTHQILNVIETSRMKGMQTMEQAVRSLIGRRVVDEEVAKSILMGTED